MDKDTRRKVGGAALAAGGAGLALGVPGVARAELKLAGARTARLDRKLAQAKSAIPKKPDPAHRLYGGRYHPESGKAKVLRSQETKRVSGQIDELNRKRRAANRPKAYHQQTRLWGTAVPVGGAASYVGARQMVDKADKRDVNAGYAGAGAGFVGYQGGSLALKPFEKPAERKIKADPKLQRDLVAHRTKTLPKNAPAGHPAWGTYNRTYPKHLPGARMKRVTARAVSGKSGALATLGVMGAGAAGGVGLKRHQEKVRKTMEISKLEWSGTATKKQKAGYAAAAAPTMLASAGGGALMGSALGEHASMHGWKQGAKLAAKSTRGRVGAGLGVAGVGAAGLAQHVGRKKGIVVSNKEGQALKRKAVQKNHRLSAFGIEH